MDSYRFPRQGLNLNQRVLVALGGDSRSQARGLVVRDDIDKPHVLIIRLDDGRYVLGSEVRFL